MRYTEEEALEYIKENDVKFIKLFFTDIFGQIKSLSVQPAEMPRAFSSGIAFDAEVVKGFQDPDHSDLFLVPDPATLCVLPWRPQNGRVIRFFCNVRYVDGSPFEGDPRYLLKKVVQKAADKGYTFNIGTECEFYLFKNDENGQPTKIPQDQAGYCDLAPRDRGENVRREICLTLEQMGLHPEASHHESGPGQNEVDFRFDSPLQAADNLATFKIVVKTIADRNGLFASFMPKPLADSAGNGLHINISLAKDGKNLFSDDDIAVEGRSFMAGILELVPEFTAFTNPLPSSYRRFGAFEAPHYISWAREKRCQLLRIPASNEPRARFELRSPDPSCNQYLALALVLSAGMEGIEKKSVLPPQKNIDLYKALPSDLQGLGTLPHSLAEAVKNALSSQFVSSVLPDVTMNAFREAEANAKDPDFGEI